jgi:hypothetical protein
MSHVNKILYTLILPVMIFSFTGASMHLHVCSKKGSSISIKLPAHKDNDHSKACCFQSDMKGCCSTHPLETEVNETKAPCCLDFEKKIETDKDYNFSHYKFNSDPVELNSIYDRTSEGYIPLICESLFPDSEIFDIPPKLHSSIVLLI